MRAIWNGSDSTDRPDSCVARPISAVLLYWMAPDDFVAVGSVLADSDSTVVVEGNHYFPAESINWELLEPTDTSTHCPWKGTASYYSAAVDGAVGKDVAWTYPAPKAAAGEIAGHVAFWRGVRVEQS